MTTTALPATRSTPGFLARHHFVLRRLHSLTGILFGLYLIVHLTVNATLIEGRGEAITDGIFQQQVNKIHSIPLLLGVEWAFIYIPLIYHTVYGIWITFTGQPNVHRYGYTRNWLYILQRATAIILVFFLLFHVLTMKGLFGGQMGEALTFNWKTSFDSTVQHLNAAWWVSYVIYPIGIVTSAFHLANGFYAAGMTWGLTISARAQQRWGIICILIFFAVLGAGTTALIGGLTAEVPVVEVAMR